MDVLGVLTNCSLELKDQGIEPTVFRFLSRYLLYVCCPFDRWL